MPEPALDRIAAAIARIEAAAVPAPARDERLRAEVAAVIAELDALIGDADG